MTETSKIIDGLKEAIAGDFPAVTIDGVRWVRESALLAAERRGIERAANVVHSYGCGAHDCPVGAAILALAPEGDGGWMPIAGAPKDGTEVDLWVRPYNGRARRACGYWWVDGIGWRTDARERDIPASSTVTHYRLVPSPPKATE